MKWVFITFPQLLDIISIQNCKCSFYFAELISNQKKWADPKTHFKISLSLIERKKKKEIVKFPFSQTGLFLFNQNSEHLLEKKQSNTSFDNCITDLLIAQRIYSAKQKQ